MFPLEAVHKLLHSGYQTVFIVPIQKLYFYGPVFLGYGFWEGASNTEICAHVTKYSQSFWESNTYDCDEIVNAKFYSFRVMVELTIYFACLFQLFCTLVNGLKSTVSFCVSKRLERRQRETVVYTLQPLTDNT